MSEYIKKVCRVLSKLWREYYLIIIFFFICWVFFSGLATRVIFGQSSLEPTQKQLAKCPDDFATAEESTDAMNQWTNAFYDTHPNASISEWGSARKQFYEDNHCYEALQRFNDYMSGKADTSAIDQAVEEELNK